MRGREHKADESSKDRGVCSFTPPSGVKMIEACSLDSTSAPSRFKGHVEDTTNLASKSGNVPTRSGSVRGLGKFLVAVLSCGIGALGHWLCFWVRQTCH